MPTDTRTKKSENRQTPSKSSDISPDDLADLSELSEAEANGMASESMIFWGIIGVIAIIIAVIVIVINGHNVEETPVPVPEITIQNSDLVSTGEDSYELTIDNTYTDIRIGFGPSSDGACKESNGFSASVNGDDITRSVGDYCHTYTIENRKIKSGGFTYKITAKNKSGEKTVSVKVEKVQQNTSKYPMTSSGMDLPTAAHVNCRSYANRYFYPDKVELNNILDGGDYDYQVDDGWLWKPIAWVTSSAGGKIAYQAVCKTDLDGHVTSFYTWE